MSEFGLDAGRQDSAVLFAHAFCDALGQQQQQAGRANFKRARVLCVVRDVGVHIVHAPKNHCSLDVLDRIFVPFCVASIYGIFGRATKKCTQSSKNVREPPI